MAVQPEKEQGGGTIIRGADGSLYFVRDEILQACKITEPECLEACSAALDSGGDVQGYVVNTNSIQNNAHVQGMIARPGVNIKGSFGNAASTVMCPWSIGRSPGGAVSNPAAR